MFSQNHASVISYTHWYIQTVFPKHFPPRKNTSFLPSFTILPPAHLCTSFKLILQAGCMRQPELRYGNLMQLFWGFHWPNRMVNPQPEWFSAILGIISPTFLEPENPVKEWVKGRYKLPQRKHGNLEFSTSCVKSGQGLVRVKGHIHFLNQDKNESKLMVSFVDHIGCHMVSKWCDRHNRKLSDLAVQDPLHHHFLLFNVAWDCVEIRQ